MARQPTRLSAEKSRALREGLVIPAHPLALDSSRHLDERHQRALTRYYLAAGAGGVAVGVHSTQFAIRDPGVDLFEPVLRIAAEEVDRFNGNRPILKIAGICGPTEQAVRETRIALDLGYDAALLSMGGLPDFDEAAHLERTRKIAEMVAVVGFYLQPAAGGRVFSFGFWREFAEIAGVIAVKIAPFNRYQTIDVVRAVCSSSRRDAIALYTGNDDQIVLDLLTRYRFRVDGRTVEKRIVGGLLGQWGVWTRRAVELLEAIKQARNQSVLASDWFTRAAEITEANAAVFDPANQFAGCIPGIHEVLRRQGLMQGRWCLRSDEVLSSGQSTAIDRIYRDYPHLTDDDFVRANLEEWLEP